MPRVISIEGSESRVIGCVLHLAGARQIIMEKLMVKAAEPDQSGMLFLQEATAGFLGAAGRHPVHIGFAGHETLLKYVRTVPVKRIEWPRVAAFEAAQVLPVSLDEISWDWHGRDDQGELELLFVAAKNVKMDQWIRLTESGGGQVAKIIPAAQALLNAYRFNYAENSESVLLIGCEERSTHLVWCDGDAFFIRTVALSAAEKPEALRKAAVQRLNAEILRTMVTGGLSRSIRPTQRIYIAGKCAAVADILEQLMVAMKLPVERLDVLRKIKIAADAEPAAREHDNELATVIGMAVVPFVKSAVDLNLLSRETKERRLHRRKQGWLAAAAVLALMAIILPVAWVFGDVRQQEIRKQRLEAELAPLRALQKKQALEKSDWAESQREYVVWQTWIKQKQAWPRFLSQLQESLWRAEDSWLVRMRVERAVIQGRVMIRVDLHGRWLDAANPLAENGTSGRAWLSSLFEEISLCDGVIALEDERFEQRKPGIVDFSCKVYLKEGELIQ